jgi:hypothetical protein
MDTFSKHFSSPANYSPYDRKKWRSLALNPNVRDSDYIPAEVSWQSSWGEELDTISPRMGAWSQEKWVQWEKDFSYDYEFDEERLALDHWSEKNLNVRQGLS